MHCPHGFSFKRVPSAPYGAPKGAGNGARNGVRGGGEGGTVVRALGWLCIALLLIVCAAGALAAENRDFAPGSGPVQSELPASEFHLTQTLSIGIGTFTGDKAAFLRYEDRALPSLNPEVELEGRVRLRTWLNPDLHVRLNTAFAGDGDGMFGIGWRAWDLEYGNHSLSFAPAGLTYVKSSTGLRVRYQQPGKPAALQLVNARSNSKYTEVTIRGDDTFGPFFLGQKKLVPQSERVVVDGVEQRRGTGPGDGDYYVDYDGGFIYFNRVLLLHETARVTFEYYFEDPALASDFTGALTNYTLGDSTIYAFALRDYTPVEEHSIVDRPGSTLVAYGAKVTTDFPSGVRLDNAVIATDLREQYAVARDGTDELTLQVGRTRYLLRRQPILYESERIVLTHPGEAPVPLVRHLDYTMDYHRGEVLFAFEPGDGASVVISYKYVDGTMPEAKAPLQGMQTANRIDYTGDRWQTSAWVDAVDGQFVNVANRTQPTVRLSAGTNTHYTLGGGWGLLGDFSVNEQRASTALTGAVGVDYRRERLETRLRLGRQVDVSDFGTTSLDYVRGGLSWRTAAQVDVDFKQQLDTYRGGLPDELEATVVGLLGRLPFALGYTHGDKHYEDKVSARLTVPAEGRNTRGFATVGTQWLFADGFGDEPRIVHSVTADVTYSPPEGLYMRGQATVSATTFGLAETRAYVLRGDLGRGLGASGLIDYQLRLNGRQTKWRRSGDGPRQTSDQSDNISHTVTVAGPIVGKTTGALAWRQSGGTRWRPDRGRAATKEQGWQLSLQSTFGPFDATLSYDTSVTDVTALGAGARATPGTGAETGAKGSARTTVERARINVDWEKNALSAQGTIEYVVYDGRRRRRTTRIMPAYDVSNSATLWLAYEHVAGVEDGNGVTRLEEEVSRYDAHLLRIGMSIEF